jgi:hypothetical protein
MRRAIRFTTIVLGWCASAFAQSDRELATRQELISQARDLSDQGKHSEALALAKRAAMIKTTPSLRLFLAEEELALGLVAEAYGSSSQCAAEAEADMRLHDRERILSGCKTLETSLGKRVGRITVKLPFAATPDVHVTVSGEELSPHLLGAPYVISPGKLTLSVTATGYLPSKIEVYVPEGETVPVDVRLLREPPLAVPLCADNKELVRGVCMEACASGKTRTPETAARCCWSGQTWSAKASACFGEPRCPEGLSARGEDCVAAPAQTNAPRTGSNRALVAIGLASAGAVVGAVATVLYLQAGSRYSSLKTLCNNPPGCTTAAYEDGRSTVERDVAFGVGGWVAAGALVGAGAVWYLVSAPEDAPRAARSAQLVVNPVTRAIGLEGRF